MEYWGKIKDIKPENLVFLDKTGIILGLIRTHARSQPGTRISSLKPFYRGAKVTAIGAISINKVLALMTMNDAMDGRAFGIAQLWYAIDSTPARNKHISASNRHSFML